jgi:hypothetical protein
MRKLLTILIVLAIYELSFPVVYETFILAGQSNMVGAGGESSTLADSFKVMPPNIKFYEKTVARNLVVSTVPTFGPEVRFCFELARKWPERNFLIVKYALGGTSLYAWAPVWDSVSAAITDNEKSGSLYTILMNSFKKDTIGKEINMRGILWMQGERDAMYLTSALNYLANFRTLIDSLRSQLKTPELPFLFGRIYAPTYKYRDSVRSAQSHAARVISNTRMVVTDDLPLFDGVHFNTQGQLELGKRFFDTYLDITNQSTALEKGEPSSALQIAVNPNPFTSGTMVHVNLSHSANISATVLDVCGRVISKLPFTTSMTLGTSAFWNGMNSDQRKVAPGIYIIHVKAGNEQRNAKILVTR